MGAIRGIVLAGSLLAMLAVAGIVRAQAPTFAEQQQRLRAANNASAQAEARATQLDRAAAGARDQAEQARARQAAAAERAKAAQADIVAARARIAIIDRLLAAQRMRVGEQQGPILRLIAALQSMARRPPVLGLVQPGSTADIVHVRAVLGTAMPVVERRTAEVRAELTRIRQLRATANSAVAALRTGRQRLESERIALVKLEAEQRARSSELARGAMVESDRALALGERAREIAGEIETSGEGAEIQAALLALPGPLLRPGDNGGVTTANGVPYRLPVLGRIVSGMGELSQTGVRSRGVTLACAAKALAVAPAAGRVRYAGPFRGYGGVVILDHGNGWTSLVTGLGAIAVRVDDQVAQGGTIGRASGGDDPRVTVELRRQGRPMDLVQLLN